VFVSTPWCVTVAHLDLPQVDHGGGRARGRERATRVACRNLNRIKNFGANNFDILNGVYISYNYFTAPTMGLQKHKKFSRSDISWSSNETVCPKCGNEITDPS
jgi:hypothetical protein